MKNQSRSQSINARASQLFLCLEKMRTVNIAISSRGFCAVFDNCAIDAIVLITDICHDSYLSYSVSLRAHYIKALWAPSVGHRITNFSSSFFFHLN